MSLAMARLKSIGWLALVFCVAILLYPLSLRVATTRSDLLRVERQILTAKKDISFLEAETRTRASLAQLEDWNRLLYGYQAPAPRQYVEGERALAELGGSVPEVRPILVSASESLGGVRPAGVIGSVFGGSASPQSADSDAEAKDVPKPAGAPESGEPVAKDQGTTRNARLAQMDQKLLSDSALDELRRAAKREGQRK